MTYQGPYVDCAAFGGRQSKIVQADTNGRTQPPTYLFHLLYNIMFGLELATPLARPNYSRLAFAAFVLPAFPFFARRAVAGFAGSGEAHSFHGLFVRQQGRRLMRSHRARRRKG